ncbi:MAG: serine/threonine-protein kinase [Rubrobacteraceae bacterium]|nr:serine/threonine protein kinase [Rubrobacter sp.]MDQ3316493.1 serine/threonine protein kinase [Actinomycetota bacterium]
MAETRYIEGQDRYELAEMVGRGGFATVWRARTAPGALGRGRDVAIKIIPVYSEGERSRAMREGQIAEGLRHKNIVETVEVIPGDYEVYLVTEYVHGLPLNEAAQSYDVDEVIDALAQILEALDYAHGQGIIHRDIKPQNALMDRKGRVKLTDFGVAYRPGDTRLTQVGFAVGTPGYIAPEIMDGADPSELSDIYAVGATARTLLAHQPDTLPPRLREFVDRATSPNPDHRPRNARAALKLLTGRRGRSTDVATDETQGKASRKFTDHLLRAANGVAAAWLGYLLGAQILQQDGAQAIGIAAGLGVIGYLLPRIAALGLVVALAVALLKNGVGLGFAVLVPAIGGTWILGGGAVSGGVSKLPLGPVLGVPMAAVGLGAGLPLLFGALMRPLGAVLSAAAGALFLIAYDLKLGSDRVLPYSGQGGFDPIPSRLGIESLIQWSGAILDYYPELPLLAVLWAVMAGVLSLAEWTGRWVVGLLVAVGGGVLGYALVISENPDALTQAMTSLGFAAIMYGVLRYLGSRVRG